MDQLLLRQLDWIRAWKIDPAVAAVWGILWAAALSTLLIRARRNYLALPELAECAPQPEPPDCMVVIPARNEEDVIGRAVRSLPPDSVIVIDDESTDNTGKEAEAAGAGVYRVPALPRGAVGKPYACMAGARAVKTKWIVFADADTWYDEGMIESLIYAAEMNRLSFISVHLKLECESIAEHILSPYVQALFFSGIDPRKCPEGAFNGQCVLVRREAYEFIGGHGAGVTFLLDDVKLALLAQRHRMKLGLARTSGLGYARYQKGWKGLWEGIARHAYRFTLLSGGQGLFVLATAFTAALWLPVAAVVYAGGWPLLSVILLVLPFLLLMAWYRSTIRALLVPVAIYAMLPFMAHALYCVLTTTHVSWKGREV